jgi:tetratricopeptide (TPR) repeat protein
MTKRYTDNNAAYLEYLKGRYQWNKRDVESFNRAVGHFKAAIDHDPTFALAYAGLADAYSMLPMWGEGTSHDFCPRAKAAARKALEIDENLAEAHASLGYVKYVYDWDFAGAENSYRRAIALNPNYALVRAWYAKFLVVMRRFDEAFEQIKLAYALDPLSPQTGASFGGFYLYSGQYDEAIRHYGKMLQMTPNFVPALIGLGQSYGQKGFFKEAVEMHEKAVLHSAEHPILLGVLACSKALAGERDEARKIVEKLERAVADCPMLPYSIATVYSCLSEKQAAFEWLEKAYTERNSHLPDINIDPEFDNLRDDLRFEDLLRRIGLN